MTKPLPPVLSRPESDTLQARVDALLSRMTLAEKIGQTHQVDAGGDTISDDLRRAIREGQIGAVINQTNAETCNELQRLAVEESRLGIPLLCGRDVIHGFRTVMPIPLGQAASWNPDLVREAARLSAIEARRNGINWTFAPMVDISRDPRWGRIAESLGEDPYLTSILGVAMAKGLQGDDLSGPNSIAACAKHFAGYGASESGRDYNTTNIPENELRNVYLPPFRALVDAGIATVMTSFSDIDGVPASANAFLLSDILRDEWGFAGFVVSDWDSVRELSVHGITGNDEEAAIAAVRAGVDMEMAGGAYLEYLEGLVTSGRVRMETIDRMAGNILLIKMKLGLFETQCGDPVALPEHGSEAAIEISRRLARESVVMLRNDNEVLPLRAEKLASVAVVGPLADAPTDQLGTWVFDGDPQLSITPLQAIREQAGNRIVVHHALGLRYSRDRDASLFGEALDAARASDAVILFLGEEAILSGEAHSRADISLPGAQAELVQHLRQAGKPLILVIMAGRPLTLGNVLDASDAILFAWHPGTMAGPAISDLLFGLASPSGKLPVTFPKSVGQIPIYYNHRNTGRPPTSKEMVLIDDIEIGATQTSLGMTAYHLDTGHAPLFPFGFGLSYARFDYGCLELSGDVIGPDDVLTVSVNVTNAGDRAGDEVVQLYVRDLVGSLTRPVRELKGFRRVSLVPGEQQTVSFELTARDLSFYRRNKSFGAEPGDFKVWVGGSSAGGLSAGFRLSGTGAG